MSRSLLFGLVSLFLLGSDRGCFFLSWEEFYAYRIYLLERLDKAMGEFNQTLRLVQG